MSKTKLKNLILVASLCGSLIGCGKTDSVVNVAGPAGPGVAAAPLSNSCPAGQISILGGPCAPDFTSACSWGGGVLTSVSGVQVCRAQKYLSFYSSFTILNPDSPVGPYAFNTGFQLGRNDRVQVSATGHWGYPSSSSFSWLGGFITGSTWNLNCDDIDINGYKNSQQGFYENLPTGLVLSDSTKVYFVGSSTTFTVENTGVLRFGLNANPSAGGGCGQITINQLVVTRCQDASGNLYVCQ